MKKLVEMKFPSIHQKESRSFSPEEEKENFKKGQLSLWNFHSFRRFSVELVIEFFAVGVNNSVNLSFSSELRSGVKWCVQKGEENSIVGEKILSEKKKKIQKSFSK